LEKTATHTNISAYHPALTEGVYSVGFNVFRFLSRRPRIW